MRHTLTIYAPYESWTLSHDTDINDLRRQLDDPDTRIIRFKRDHDLTVTLYKDHITAWTLN